MVESFGLGLRNRLPRQQRLYLDSVLEVDNVAMEEVPKKASAAFVVAAVTAAPAA